MIWEDFEFFCVTFVLIEDDQQNLFEILLKSRSEDVFMVLWYPSEVIGSAIDGMVVFCGF